MEWQRDRKAMSDQPAVVPLRVAPAPLLWLALLPLQRPPVRLYVAHPTAAPPGLPVATYHRFAARSIRDPIARLTCTISSLVARTACSQCSRCHSRASHDLAVWCLRHLRDPVQISIGI